MSGREFKTFNEWLLQVPEAITDDALWSLQVYRLSLFAADIAWKDVQGLGRTIGAREIADQLFRAVGSMSANIAEGYSRGSGKDRVRFYEYALGSARESRDWYYKCRPILGLPAVEHRLNLATHVIRLLLSIIPEERSISLSRKTVKESHSDYGFDCARPIPWANQP